MQLRNGKRKLDAYQPTFDPHLDIATVVFSHVQCVKTRVNLALVSKLWREASKPAAAYPRFFDFEGVEGDVANHLVRLLDDDRVRSLGKKRALQLIGVHGDRLCQYACGRSFEVLKWAFNELHLPWAQYPAEPVSDDVLVLRALRAMWPKLQERLPEAARPEDWHGVTMENGRVVELRLYNVRLGGAVPAVIGQLTSLVYLDLGFNELTSVPAEIGQLTALEELDLCANKLTSVPAEIGRLTSLTKLVLGCNQLTGVPAEIWQLTSLRELDLSENQLTSLATEIGQLTSLMELHLEHNQLTSLPAEIGQLSSLEHLALYRNQLTSLPAEIGQLTSLWFLNLSENELSSLPAEIWQLTELEQLHLFDNQLTSLPAEILQLTSLRELDISENQLTSTSVPAAIREYLDDAVMVDE